MKIRINGQDQTSPLLPELTAAAQAHHDAALTAAIERERPILELRDAPDESAWLTLHARLLRTRNAVDPTNFEPPPPAPGLAGRLRSCIRKRLWKSLRFQHDWMAFRTNTILMQLTHQLEAEKDARKQLEEKIHNLEKRLPPKPQSRPDKGDA
jgi:hypothetical protein